MANMIVQFYPTALNSPDSKDTDIAAITDSVVECIFSVLVTLGMQLHT